MVAPARTRDGHELVLKLGWRRREAEHEAVGLTYWVGGGAVVAARVPPAGTEDVQLELIETRTFGSRVIYARYRIIGADPD
jgi:hypothetical protein